MKADVPVWAPTEPTTSSKLDTSGSNGPITKAQERIPAGAHTVEERRRSVCGALGVLVDPRVSSAKD